MEAGTEWNVLGDGARLHEARDLGCPEKAGAVHEARMYQNFTYYVSLTFSGEDQGLDDE